MRTSESALVWYIVPADLSGRQAVMERFRETIGYHPTGRHTVWPHESLSVRELEVLSLLAKGRTVSQVAKRLKLSVKTVSTYRTRLLEKLRLGTTADLIRYAERLSLMSCHQFGSSV